MRNLISILYIAAVVVVQRSGLQPDPERAVRVLRGRPHRLGVLAGSGRGREDEGPRHERDGL